MRRVGTSLHFLHERSLGFQFDVWDPHFGQRRALAHKHPNPHHLIATLIEIDMLPSYLDETKQKFGVSLAVGSWVFSQLGFSFCFGYFRSTYYYTQPVPGGVYPNRICW